MKSQWAVPQEVLKIECYPPYVRRQVGRPRKKRILSEGEFRRAVIKKTRQPITCGICGNTSHNRKTCNNRVLNED